MALATDSLSSNITTRLPTMSAISVPSRKHHSELKPLATSPAPRRKLTQSSPSTPSISALSLPSPSAIAAHAYYLGHETSLEISKAAIQRRQTLFHSDHPRRHSTIVTPGNLVAQLSTITFSSTTNRVLPSILEPLDTDVQIKIEKTDDASKTESSNDVETLEANGVTKEIRSCLNKTHPQNDLTKIRTITACRQSASSPAPFLYVHDRLRDWGSVYLGNSSTADAFVNAVSLRRPSMAPVAKVKPTTLNTVTIRARVSPKAKERRPFLIQRRFDIENLRSSIPEAQQSTTGRASPPSTKLRRSSRRKDSAQGVTNDGKGRRKGLEFRSGDTLPVLSNGAVPIHVEYALHHLPVLAALLLSGHIRKGDTIDLPLPHPEAWKDVITWIYTGKPELTLAMREDIVYLAGNLPAKSHDWEEYLVE